MAESFARLGLSVDELKQLSPEEQFYAVADALAKVEAQYEQTELGRAIFGRGFANLLPLIKEANGDLDEHVEKLKEMEQALSQETIDRIDAFGDALAGAGIKAKNAFVEAFAAILNVADGVGKYLPSAGEMKNARLSNYGITDTSRRLTSEDLYAMQAKDGGFVTEATRVSGYTFDAKGNLVPPQAATSSGGARKASGTAKRQEAEDYDAVNNALDDYIHNLETEHQLLGLTSRDRAAARAVMDAQSAAMKQGNLLTEEQIGHVRELALSNYDLQNSMDKVGESAVINARLVKDSFADALESVLFDFENLGDSATSILDGIGRNIARKGLIDPLSTAASGMFDGLLKGGSLADLFGGFFADGGSPPVGRPSVVGERGPEIFVPSAAGTVVPNHALGGTSVTVVQHNSFGSGVSRAEVANMLPALAQASKQAVFAEIQKGGTAAQTVGRRA